MKAGNESVRVGLAQINPTVGDLDLALSGLVRAGEGAALIAE